MCIRSGSCRSSSYSVTLWTLLTLLAATTHASRKTPQQRGGHEDIAYAIMIDAGSTGSRVHIYSYNPPATPSRYASVRLPEPKLSVSPGLSAFVSNGTGAGESIQPLLAFAKLQVPKRQWEVTPVHLMATAGLRMLPQNESEGILASCRSALSVSGLLFKAEWARQLSGDLEGLYAWTAVNYAAGTLQAMAQARREPRLKAPVQGAPEAARSTWGVFELGGASMQITFVPEERLPPKWSTMLPLPGLHHLPIYTKSFLGYGIGAAFVRVSAEVSRGNRSTHPCLPVGYTGASGLPGGGDYAACRDVSRQLISTVDAEGGCKHKICTLGGELLPQLSGMYLAMENFFYTADRLELSSTASLAELEATGMEFCSKTWPQLQQEMVQDRSVREEYAVHTCFAAAYIFTLLRDGFHMELDDKRLLFSNSVATPSGEAVYEAKWVMGALLVEVIHAVTAVTPAAGTGRPGDHPQQQAVQGSPASNGADSSVTGVRSSLQPPPSGLSSSGWAAAGRSSGGILQALGSNLQRVDLTALVALVGVVSAMTLVLHWGVFWELLHPPADESLDDSVAGGIGAVGGVANSGVARGTMAGGSIAGTRGAEQL